MATASTTKPPPPQLSADARAFLSAYRALARRQRWRPHGAKDDDDGDDELSLRRSLTRAAEAAVAAGARDYPCVRAWGFAEPRVGSHPAYTWLLTALGGGDGAKGASSTPSPRGVAVEVGCGFGSDIRRLLLDGVAPAHAVASDLHGEYWAAGARELFGDGGAGVRTVFGDWTTGGGGLNADAIHDGEGPRGGETAKVVHGGDHDAYAAYAPGVWAPGPTACAVQEAATEVGGVLAVFATAVLHCLGDSGAAALAANAHSVLVRGGRFFGTALGRRDGAGIHSMGEAGDTASPDLDLSTHAAAAGDFAGWKLHTAGTLAGMLERVGFTGVQVVPRTIAQLAAGARAKGREDSMGLASVLRVYRADRAANPDAAELVLLVFTATKPEAEADGGSRAVGE
ncbi:hypothetical protein HK405_003746, partial [Cladochytrium tenue]